MFKGCTSLIEGADIPATNAPYSCCLSMFDGCTLLIKAPASLSATLNGPQCYKNMFHNCISLRIAPSLPALSLTNNCYQNMFNGCSSLSSMNINFTNWRNDIDSTLNWVNGIASQGTFIKPSALSEQYGVSRIPTGWTIINK